MIVKTNNKATASILGGFIFLGLLSLGLLLGKAAIDYKQLDRSVTVKGLSEKEYQADIVIWPITFTQASNELSSLYSDIETSSNLIQTFLLKHGVEQAELTFATPAITDKSAQEYGSNGNVQFRYTASQTVTVYSKNIDGVREVMGRLSELGKEGIVFTGSRYDNRTEYLFTRLNEIKPVMIEEATRKAREVAQKFASDSNSQLGKIKRASQGRFSINARDNNNPHIKKVRVVSTVEYYFSD